MAKNRSKIGRNEIVLIDQLYSKKDPTMAQGRTDGNTVVSVSNDNLKLGDWVRVYIEDVTPHTLKGSVVSIL